MTEFFNFLIQTVIIFFVVKFLLELAAWFLINRFKDEIKEIADRKKIEDTAIVLDTSKYQDQLLCHDADTGDFVCQGKTMAELVQNFKLRYPNKSAIIQGDQDVIDELKKEGIV